MPAGHSLPPRVTETFREQRRQLELLTHGREPLWARVVGKVGEIFRKKGRGWGKGFTVVQVQRII